MDRSTFGALTRRVARQTTRRAALATLLSGALLFNTLDTSEATNEAERRKDRRKQRRRKDARGAALKPVSIRVYNPGRNNVTVQGGHVRSASNLRLECVFNNRITIPPGGTWRYQSPSRKGHMWINGQYWIQFNNVYLGPPEVSAAVNGTPLPFTQNCPPRGTTILWSKGMSEHQTVNITMLGNVFKATRNRDTNYKEFTITLPTKI